MKYHVMNLLWFVILVTLINVTPFFFTGWFMLVWIPLMWISIKNYDKSTVSMYLYRHGCKDDEIKEVLQND